MKTSLRSGLSALLIGLSLMLAAPAFAAPAMFSGFWDSNSSYRDICAPGAFFYGGDSGYSCPAYFAPASSVASVDTGTGGFTVPPGLFTVSTYVYTGVFPGYPVFHFTATVTAGSGSFKNGYFANAGVMTTVSTNTTAFPVSSIVPRKGKFYITYGPNGFGGTQPVTIVDDYTGLVQPGGFGTYDFALSFVRPRGGSQAWNSHVGRGTQTHTDTMVKSVTPSGSTTLMGASLWASTAMPFLTGTVMVYAPQGNTVTQRTGSGMDSRTTGMYTSGVISLVSPTIIWNYAAHPDEFGTIQLLQGNFGSFDTLTLTFMPEPGQLALLGAGALGLLALYRVRRR